MNNGSICRADNTGFLYLSSTTNNFQDKASSSSLAAEANPLYMYKDSVIKTRAGPEGGGEYVLFRLFNIDYRCLYVCVRSDMSIETTWKYVGKYEHVLVCVSICMFIKVGCEI